MLQTKNLNMSAVRQHYLCSDDSRTCRSTSLTHSKSDPISWWPSDLILYSLVILYVWIEWKDIDLMISKRIFANRVYFSLILFLSFRPLTRNIQKFLSGYKLKTRKNLLKTSRISFSLRRQHHSHFSFNNILTVATFVFEVPWLTRLNRSDDCKIQQLSC